MKFSYLAGGLRGKLLVAAGVCVGMLAVSAPASADSTFTTQFFTVTSSTAADSDFDRQNVPTGTTSTNYVMSTLSGGMPVFNTSENGAAAAHDLGAGNVLEWWTPGTYGPNTVTYTGTGPLTVSSDVNHPTNMFPPNSTGGDNTDGLEETAILSGMFNGNATFTIAADDDAFVFIDGVLAEDLGGIHAIESATFSSNLGAGPHTILIFYADQDEVAASLAFSSNVDITPTPTPTPEPGSLALLGTGVLAMGGTIRRRMKR